MFAEDRRGQRRSLEGESGPTLRWEERQGKDSPTYTRTRQAASSAQVVLRTCLLCRRLAPCFRPLRHTGSALGAACRGEAVPRGSRRGPKKAFGLLHPVSLQQRLEVNALIPSTRVFRDTLSPRPWGFGALCQPAGAWGLASVCPPTCRTGTIIALTHLAQVSGGPCAPGRAGSASTS